MAKLLQGSKISRQILFRPRWLGLGLVCGVTLGAFPAYANSWPPMAIFLLHLPLLPSFATYGLGLLGIVVLEAMVLSRREGIKFLKAFGYTALANLVSLIMGCLITFCFLQLPYLFYGDITSKLWIFGIPLLIAYVILVSSSISVFTADDAVTNYMTKIRALLMWSLIWLVGLVLIVFLFSAVSSINRGLGNAGVFPDPNASFFVNLLQLLDAALFLILGFTMSWVTEAWVLRNAFHNRTKQFLRTVLIMNVRSYCYIAVPITLLVLLRLR